MTFDSSVTISWRTLTLAAGLALTACASNQGTPALPAANEVAPQVVTCPKELPSGVRCLGGRDSAGAHYLIAIPARWNQTLLLHAHGGPSLRPSDPERITEDLVRWKALVSAGYAWAGVSFTKAGFQVRSAAADVERLRGIFHQHVAQPRRTILHGQSWGAGVAIQAAESATARHKYDAVLLTSGLVAGGSVSYDFRLDLRAVYQAICANHPRADEPDYPLWQGLPVGASLTREALATRARECLGLGVEPARRSAEQARRLRALLAAVAIPESSVLAHLSFATFNFQHLSHIDFRGRSVLSNAGVKYRTTEDDPTLNSRVQRYGADPSALREFARDSDPQGTIDLPTLSVHAISDPQVFVEQQSAYRDRVEASGRSHRLLQVYTRHAVHSYLSDETYVAALAAMEQWLDSGRRPTPTVVADICSALPAPWRKGGCQFAPTFQPDSLASRVPPRVKP